MNVKLIIIILATIGLCACSALSGGDGEKRVVDEEEITVGKVYISKNRAHCEDKSGRALDETKAELEAEGIKVFSSDCGVITGKMAPAMCGATTLDINIHGIDERKFPDAEALGYKPVSSFEKGIGYETLSCE